MVRANIANRIDFSSIPRRDWQWRWTMYQTFSMAAKIGKNRLAAARIRTRYLLEQLEECIEIGSDISIYDGWEIVDEIIYLFKNAPKTPEKKGFARFTDEEIEKAMSFPVENLIVFTRNKATAWCHDDKRPSLSLSKKKNRAFCPVCGKSFNAIQILMHRDGKTFREAVKELL